MNREKFGSLAKRLLFLNENMHLSSYLVRLVVGAYVLYAVITDLTTGNTAILIAIAAYLIVGGLVGICDRLMKRSKASDKEEDKQKTPRGY